MMKAQYQSKMHSTLRAMGKPTHPMTTRVKPKVKAGISVQHLQTLADTLRYLSPSRTMVRPGHFPESGVAEIVRYTD